MKKGYSYVPMMFSGRGFFTGVESRIPPLLILLVILLYPYVFDAQAQNSYDSLLMVESGIPPRDSLRVVSGLSEARIAIGEGRTDEAYDILQKTLEVSKLHNFREGKANSYMLLADIGRERQNYPDVLRNLFSAYREYEWLDEKGLMADILLNAGKAYERALLHRKALDYFLDADSLYTTTGFENLQVKRLIADSYLKLMKFEEALSYYTSLAGKYKSQNNRDELIQVYSRMIICYKELGDYSNVESLVRESLKLYEMASDTGGMITALNNLGFNYKYIGEFEKAGEYLRRSLEMSENRADPVQVWVILLNLGVINQNLGNLDQAIDYLNRAYRLAELNGMQKEAAEALHLLSLVYFNNEDLYNAEVYSEMALATIEGSGDIKLKSEILLASSKIKTELYDYEAALQDYRDYLFYRDSALLEQRKRQDEVLQQEYLVERYEREISLLVTDEELEEARKRELIMDTIKKRQQIELQARTIELQDSELRNQELENIRLEQEKMLAEEKLASEIRDREILELKIVQQAQEDSLRQAEYLVRLTETENERLTAESELQDETIRRIRARNAFLAGIFILALIILVILFFGWRYSRKTNRILKDQRNKIQQQKDAIQSQYDVIERERARSDKLLLNILPEETAEELKEKGKATPRLYEMVTVLFTDFKGFTNIAMRLSPEEVVAELDKCFLEFDRIADRHNLEKIKTIGDAYMCAGGLPVANSTNPVDAVRAALEINEFMEQERRIRAERGEKYWELRIGINTGPVIAGVVGKNKFAYDIWGDTVNTASRMESSGEPGRVNISGDTYELVKDHFICTYRGKIEAKNKGEIDMYFVEKVKG